MYLFCTPDNTTPIPVLSCVITSFQLNRRLTPLKLFHLGVSTHGWGHSHGANWSLTPESTCPHDWILLLFVPITPPNQPTLPQPLARRPSTPYYRSTLLDAPRLRPLGLTKLSKDTLSFDRGPPRGNRNHLSLCFDNICFSCPKPSENRKRNLWKGDFEGMERHHCLQNWDTMLVGDIETKWLGLKTVLLDPIE